MSLLQRLSRLEANTEQHPNGIYKHARDLTDTQLEQLIRGDDIGIRLIITPREREAIASLTDDDIEIITNLGNQLVLEGAI